MTRMITARRSWCLVLMPLALGCDEPEPTLAPDTSTAVSAAAAVLASGMVDGIETRITAWPGNEVQPRISGERIVWKDFRNTGPSGIYMYDLSTRTEQLLVATNDHLWIAFAGDRVVWEDDRDGHSDIYLYDLSTGTETRLTSHPGAQRFPDISGDRIVWADDRNGNFDIYLHDLSTGARRQLSDVGDQFWPAIDGDRVVWEDRRDGVWSVFLYDLATDTETRIPGSAVDLSVVNGPPFPAISGERIVWRRVSPDAPGVHLHVHDLSTGVTTRITRDGLARAGVPDISGDRIAWADFRDGALDSEIFLYDLTTGIESVVTDAPDIQRDARISGSRIVWTDRRNEDTNRDVYLFEIGGPQNVSPIADAGGPYAGDEGSAIEFDASGSSDADGDDLDFAWDFGDGGTGEGVGPLHAYADDGEYTATVTVSDAEGATASATAAVSIANVPPAIGEFDGAEILEGETYAAEGSFTDPGADTWTATVDYGDGTGVQALALDGRTFTLSHVYETAGEYAATVAVADDDGGEGSGDASVVVLSPQQAAEALIDRIDELADGGDLSPGEAEALKAMLAGAARQLERGNERAATNQLGAFTRTVDALVRSGRLDAAAGEELIQYAQRIAASLD